MSKTKMEIGQFVVYPAHGVGKVLGYKKSVICEQQIEVVLIEFEKEKMVLQVPVNKITEVGLRKLSSKKMIKQALDILTVPVKKKKLMWSRRALEYETKINSGDIISIAEVVRTLYKDNDKSTQSYSERQIYNDALNRLIAEYMTVEEIDFNEANKKIEQLLSSVI